MTYTQPTLSRKHAALGGVLAVAVVAVVVLTQVPALSPLGSGIDAPTSCEPSDTARTSEWTRWNTLREPSLGLYDPVLFVEPEREHPYRLFVAPDDGEMDLYESRDMAEFETVAESVEGAEFASNFNWGRKVDGRYYLFRTLEEERTELWTGDSLTNLTNHGVVIEEADTGGYYDRETGTWHLYYQQERGSGDDDRFGPNTDRFGHATSRDGFNWTKQGVALDVSDRPWKAGDPDVIRIDDRYYMFFDQTTAHPRYHVHLATSENLSSFEPVGRVTEACGGDPKVRYLPDQERFVMLTEFSGEDISGIGIRTSRGPGNGSYRLDGGQDIIRTTNGTDG